MAAENPKLKKVVEFINRKGFNGLIVYSNGAANILRPNHLHWFSGCRPMGAPKRGHYFKIRRCQAAGHAQMGSGPCLFEELDQGCARHLSIRR